MGRIGNEGKREGKKGRRREGRKGGEFALP